jgi:hypothetical protein
LRSLREGFKQDNNEFYHIITKSEDRIEKLDEIKSAIKTEFSTLASHTGNPDQGLSIAQYKRITEAFDIIERVAVRGNKDSYDRNRIRKGIRSDRYESRRLVYDYNAVRDEGKLLKNTIKKTIEKLDVMRDKAFHEIAGK